MHLPKETLLFIEQAASIVPESTATEQQRWENLFTTWQNATPELKGLMSESGFPFDDFLPYDGYIPSILNIL